MTPDAPICPRCSRKLHRSHPAASGKMRWCCRYRIEGKRVYCYSTTEPQALIPKSRTGDQIRARTSQQQQIIDRALSAGFQHELPVSDVYVFTCAVDRSPAHIEFLASLKQYVTHRKSQGWRASLHVIPILMKNVTHRKQEAGTLAELWAPELRPYLFAGRSDAIPHLSVIADVKIQPTAVSPLSGLNAMAGSRSILVGHPKLELTTVATPGKSLPKILTSTGAVTALDYTDTRMGKIAEFHHSQSAVVIEVDWTAGVFYMTQLCASSETGEFTDMGWHYSPGGVSAAPRPAAYVMADTHFRFHSKEAEDAKFRKGGVIEQLQPEYLLWHDLKDGYSHNHHEDKDPFIAAEKMESGLHMVRQEVIDSVKYAERLTPPDCQSIVVCSNHDEFLTRWIKEQDWKRLTSKDNMVFYLDTARRMLEGQVMTESGVRTPSPFIMWGRELVDPLKVRFLAPGEHFELAGVVLHMHGHDGPNGARGSAKNLSRIGVKSIINHGHGPNIREGLWQGGTNSVLDPSYGRGPSNWMHCDVVLHATGKRQMLFTIKGRCRLERK